MRSKPHLNLLESIRILFGGIKRVRLLALTAVAALGVFSLATESSASPITPIIQLNEVLFGKARVMSESVPSHHNATASSTNLNTARRGHTATRLRDGRALFAGGENSEGVLKGAEIKEILDPTSGTFTSGPAMGVARAGHSATLFADGSSVYRGAE